MTGDPTVQLLPSPTRPRTRIGLESWSRIVVFPEDSAMNGSIDKMIRASHHLVPVNSCVNYCVNYCVNLVNLFQVIGVNFVNSPYRKLTIDGGSN